MRALSPVVASGGHSSSRCAGLSLSWPLLLRSTGSRRTGSVIVAHGPSCSVACGIFLVQGSNPCPLHWQADPQPLRHQGSPRKPREVPLILLDVQLLFLLGHIIKFGYYNRFFCRFSAASALFKSRLTALSSNNQLALREFSLSP